ncbi:MAG: TonB-dependent receptor [Proteobacteria bacterium]|nr:TonB-dependent receptor [Pseudomonadota bacterium]
MNRTSATLAGAALVATLSFGSLPAAHAQADSAATLPPVFVTATRTPQPFASLLADVTVIGHDEIMAAGVDSLATLLQRQPGIEITQNGGPGSTSGLFVRGTNTGQVLVLVDGMRVSSSSSGTTAIEAIPLGDIDHIEIVRGPASSLYGSDAIGGVVQVFTKQGGGATTANASVGYGTYATWQGTAGGTASAGPWRFGLQATGATSDGYNAIVDPANFSYDPDRDGYKVGSVSANAALDWATGQQATANYYRSRLNAQFDGGDSYDDRTITTLETYAVGSVNRINDVWTSRLALGQGSDNSVSETGYGAYPFRTRQNQYAWVNELTFAPGVATLGLERREENVATNDAFAVTRRDTNSVFGAWQMTLAGNALQANVRHDDSSQYGGKTTGAIAWGYTFSPQWRVTASYGTAFRAPTFNDLYYPGYSNPNLVPETSRNVEGGVYWNGAVADGKLELGLVGYHNDVDNLILFECDADYNCAPQNVASATLKGLTLTASGAWGGTTLVASVDFGSPRDDATGNLLPRRALTHGTVRVGQQLGAWTLGAEVVASTMRYDDAANTIRMGGYGFVNLTADYAVTPKLTLFVRGTNVFDKNYELAAGYSTGGAQVFGGVRWTL